ncbi:uncharacterized protein LOC108679252 [Hyalella azteca]|uniref:Uncharacterized protein LOC108679252 n=1 Tax=Hyalella azteca TaxID=294128 RepID=A0A8B7PBF8_HYAAZ|nr:uncharacterized protein LOC108679252 [Hyalella azteca]
MCVRGRDLFESINKCGAVLFSKDASTEPNDASKMLPPKYPRISKTSMPNGLQFPGDGKKPSQLNMVHASGLKQGNEDITPAVVNASALSWKNVGQNRDVVPFALDFTKKFSQVYCSTNRVTSNEDMNNNYEILSKPSVHEVSSSDESRNATKVINCCDKEINNSFKICKICTSKTITESFDVNNSNNKNEVREMDLPGCEADLSTKSVEIIDHPESINKNEFCEKDSRCLSNCPITFRNRKKFPKNFTISLDVNDIFEKREGEEYQESSGGFSAAPTVSLVEEYIYEDKVNGIKLIERRGPTSTCGSGTCCLSALSRMLSISEAHCSFAENPGCSAVNNPDSRHVSVVNNPDSHINSKSNSVSNVSSALTSLPASIIELSTQALKQQLIEAKTPVLGPISDGTVKSYKRLLHRLRKGCTDGVQEGKDVVYPRELQQALLHPDKVPWDRYVELEQIVSRAFSQPRSVDYWRGGTARVCFNYLLLDPSVTCDLPVRVHSLGPQEVFQVFISSIFYVGKGTKNRPYAHLYEALKLFNAEEHHGNSRSTKISAQAQRVAKLWREGNGVVSLNFFHHSICAEALTREAAIIDAIDCKWFMRRVVSGEQPSPQKTDPKKKKTASA